MTQQSPHQHPSVQQQLHERRQAALGAIFARMAHQMGNLLGNAQMRMEHLLGQMSPQAAETERLRNALEKVEQLTHLVGAWRHWLDGPALQEGDAVEVSETVEQLVEPFVAMLDGELTLDALPARGTRLSPVAYADLESGLLCCLTAVAQSRPPHAVRLTVHVPQDGRACLHLAPTGDPGGMSAALADYLHELAARLQHDAGHMAVPAATATPGLDITLTLDDG